MTGVEKKEAAQEAIRSAILDEVNAAATRIAIKVAEAIEFPDSDEVDQARLEELIQTTEDAVGEVRDRMSAMKDVIDAIQSAVGEADYLDTDLGDLEDFDGAELREAAGL